MKILLTILCYGLLTLWGRALAQTCTGSLGDPVVTIDFGHGTAKFGAALDAAKTNYTYRASDGPSDGSYTIAKTVGDGRGWFTTKNHTPNDPDGYFMMINASFDPGIFYQTETESELCPNTTYEFAAWVTNLLTYSGIKPNLTFSILSMDGQVLGTRDTGPILESTASTWTQYALSFTTTTAGKVRIQIRNNAPGGEGNDLGLDDITFRACGPAITNNIDGITAAEKVICEGGGAVLSANVSGSATLQYLWQQKNGSGWTDLTGENTTNLTLNNLAAGDHEYRLMAAEAANFNSPVCRTASPVYTLHVKAPPVVTVIPTRDVCVGSAINLDVTASEGSFQWTGPNGYASTEKSPVIQNAGFNMGGDYHVAVSTSSCVVDEVIHVTVLSLPVASVTSATLTLCEGTSTTLNASGGTTYKWSPAAGLSATDVANPTASPVQNTLYTVTVSNGPCEDNASVMVTVLKKIEVNAGENRATVVGQPIMLNGTITGEKFRYFWTPSDYLDNPEKLNPVANPVEDITYTLNVVSDEGCPGGTSSVFVKVYPKLEIPNSFSPNGDGRNDLWNIEALDGYPKATLSIFNRYGTRVFTSTSTIKRWDGKYNGKDVQSGVYYYVLKLNEPDKMVSGSIMVLR